MDATCIQIGLRERELHPEEGKISFSFCSQKVKHWIAAVLKQKCARMHQILFQFPFSPQTPATRGSAPDPRGGKGEEGRERVDRGKGEGGEREGEREVCVIAVGEDRRP